MQINFDGTDKQASGTQSKVSRETTAYHAGAETGKTGQSGFVLDITGTAADNSAYAGHGRTKEEVMQEAGNQNVTEERNYMAIMSNTVSDEDFKRLQQDGFHPGSTEIETVVTILDHIKASMMKGGADVTGYTDTVSADALEEITGSKAFAEELVKQFREKDLPLTEENIENAVKGWENIKDMEQMTEGTMKYMVENDLSTTPENLYLARFSATGDGSRQGKGYYSAGGVVGYYAKKPDEIDWQKLMPQMEKVMKQAGMEDTAENQESCKWLVEKGIPLNADTLETYSKLKSLKLPVSMEDYIKAAAAAVRDGGSPVNADLTEQTDYLKEAVYYAEAVKEVPDEAADIIQVMELPLTLKNLLAVYDQILSGSENIKDSAAKAENISGRRQLEEVRLAMTVQANLKLLKSGIQIETASLEQLVKLLKESEKSYAISLTGEADGEKAVQKKDLYEFSLLTLNDIKTAPIAIAAQVAKEDTLSDINSYGKARAAIYEKAGDAYETLMTAPRGDMGDSIKKAFANVDDILEDFKMETSDQNRRAVRILGYNSMEITPENIEKIKEPDELLTRVADAMKPGTVLKMIREGINPVTMPLEELKAYLNQQNDPAAEIESYSKFLYQMEKQDSISQDERSAYIGIYRLMRQVEKTDHAAVGALNNLGAAVTLENLLTAVRSSKKKHMNYRVDDAFSGISAKESKIASITEQIGKGIIPTSKQLKEILEEVQSEEAGDEFDRVNYDEIRNAGKTEESVLRTILEHKMPVNADTLLAAGAVLKKPAEAFRKIKKAAEKLEVSHDNKNKAVSEFEDMIKNLPEALTDKEEAAKAYENMQNVMQDIIEESAYQTEGTAIDIKAMSALHKQISYLGKMAGEENYEIPAQIDGELTSINLKIIHSTGEDSKVTISLQTELLGKVYAEFTSLNDSLDGYTACSTKQGTALLKNGEDNLKKRLTDDGIEPGQIHFITGEKQGPKAESAIEETEQKSSGGTGKLNTGSLYRTARDFIGYIQELCIKKGSINYEN